MRKFIANIKKKLPKFNKHLFCFMRFLLFLIVVLMGFWAIYSILWQLLGFPLSNNAMYLLLGQSVISEIMLIRWLSD